MLHLVSFTATNVTCCKKEMLLTDSRAEWSNTGSQITITSKTIKTLCLLYVVRSCAGILAKGLKPNDQLGRLAIFYCMQKFYDENLQCHLEAYAPVVLPQKRNIQLLFAGNYVRNRSPPLSVLFQMIISEKKSFLVKYSLPHSRVFNSAWGKGLDLPINRV